MLGCGYRVLQAFFGLKGLSLLEYGFWSAAGASKDPINPTRQLTLPCDEARCPGWGLTCGLINYVTNDNLLQNILEKCWKDVRNMSAEHAIIMQCHVIVVSLPGVQCLSGVPTMSYEQSDAYKALFSLARTNNDQATVLPVVSMPKEKQNAPSKNPNTKTMKLHERPPWGIVRYYLKGK